ncbi:uncharacterized protein [Physcomitrium patens]|uniref:Uncharacterized protein n=1 Tax=Physcomitrium patens TaxID=3218 RepID=A0A2K1JJA8_PHYPA|nr:uncharacterized protein LOC112291645 isoform X1 [Physcomitrium patens]PNR41632.1 hypothetical protein PHYPA_019037 [Physcomitrium patens]|eukprot:XP_024395136.1 uncharacterized protein LOC112291645 isoform X1 [Physcomitrella patens]
MGAADSKLPTQGVVDSIETIKGGRSAEGLDPCIERLQNLSVAEPLLKSPVGESSLTDVLLERNFPQSRSVDYGSLDATTTAQLLSLYQEWQRLTADQVSKKQEEIGFKIDAVEAVAMKLLQRLNYSASVMKTSAASLQDVQYLKVEVLEMKKALNIVLEKYEALCKRVEQQGPDFLSGPTRAPAFTALGTEISLSEALQQIFRTGSSMVDSKPP